MADDIFKINSGEEIHNGCPLVKTARIFTQTLGNCNDVTVNINTLLDGRLDDVLYYWGDNGSIIACDFNNDFNSDFCQP